MTADDRPQRDNSAVLRERFGDLFCVRRATDTVGLVAPQAALPGRISAIRPVGGAHPVAGVLARACCRPTSSARCFVLGFLRYGLPPQDRIELQDLPTLNLAIFSSSLVLLFLAGSLINLRLLMPVFRWQRRDDLLADADPAATELARSRALRMPFYRTLISMVDWCIGGVVFIVASWSVAKHAAPVVAVATPWAPPRPRSSAICSPSGCCGRWRSPRCAAGCRRTSGRPASSCGRC